MLIVDIAQRQRREAVSLAKESQNRRDIPSPESLSRRKRHKTGHMPCAIKVMAPGTLVPVLLPPPSPLLFPLLPRLRPVSVVTGLGSFQNVQGRTTLFDGGETTSSQL
ncbi:hypothetical protein CTA1_11141 [Colletotrichum tanaceti]|uniref:Uncharacterized protein n=1 Tax=Colletotrichum tanaceti TaxID=1306861 RepID=A0A4U6XQQ4_9PEZI|nr:hypothetical protein CTA1_11141 [Colletotrichum tanaceti]